MPGSIRWLYSGTGTNAGSPQVPDDPDGHGSCVASKITGDICGTAKRANLVVMKIESGGRGLDIGIVRSLALVAIDIRDHGWQGKAVINLSASMLFQDNSGSLSPPARRFG
jgi:hypothetical protein